MIVALWVRGSGVWIASTVQGEGHRRLQTLAPTLAPQIWHEIRKRVLTGNSRSDEPALYHAEDAAMFWYESNRGSTALASPYP